MKGHRANPAFETIRDIAAISNDYIPLPRISTSWEALDSGGFGEVKKGEWEGKVYVLKTPVLHGKVEEHRRIQGVRILHIFSIHCTG